MRKLITQQNQVTYAGNFERPPLSLWGDGQALMGGLLEVLAPFGTSIHGVTMEATSAKPVEQGILYDFGKQASYRFSLGAIRAELQGFSDKELEAFPDLIQKAESWIRRSASTASFRSHLYSYSAHVQVEGTTSEDVLRNLSDLHVTPLGSNRGAGVTFHGEKPDGEEAQVQLSLDHSLLFAGGLFIHFLWMGLADVVDHAAVVRVNRARLERALAELQLEFATT